MLTVHDDLRYELLDLNVQAMQLCQSRSFDDAEQALTAAYARLQGDNTIDDPTLVEKLKATTMNNLGVVESHKSQHRKALEHLESAYSIESRLGLQSPTTIINLSAVNNALGDYERAASLALQAIDVLHETASRQELDGESKMLWGAAWHNLGVAQLNSATEDEVEQGTVLAIFRNAMKSTQDLLGFDHAMTRAVHETYRTVREHLKEHGVFNHHRTFPPLDARKRQMALTLRPSSKPSQAYTETTFSVPYTTDKGAKLSPRSSKKPPSSRMPFNLDGTLLMAEKLYGDVHPMLKSMGKAAISPRGLPTSPRRANLTGGTNRSVTKRNSPTDLERPYALPSLPSPPKNGPAIGSIHPSPRRRISELLMGDMWVELAVPPPPAGLLAPIQGNEKGNSPGRQPIRPTYGEAMYVIRPDDPMLEPVINPGEKAQMLPADPRPAIEGPTLPAQTVGDEALQPQPQQKQAEQQPKVSPQSATPTLHILAEAAKGVPSDEMSRMPGIRSLVASLDPAPPPPSGAPPQ